MPQQYLIWSIEHQAWWRPACCGYTRVLTEAGRYSETEANGVLQHANFVVTGQVYSAVTNECKIPVDAVDPTTESVE